MRLAIRATIGTMLAGTLLSCAPLPATGDAPRQSVARKPNILFVLVDDMGFADLSVTGNRKVSTPHIDRLAADGLLMTQFYVAAPICSPSRAGLMTGQYPARNGFVSFIDDRAHNIEMDQADWLDPGLPMLSRALKGVGYATGHFGKWHLGGGRDIGEAPLPAAYGFDESYTQFEGLGPRVLMTEDHHKLASKSAALGKGPIDRLPKSQITARYIDKTLDFVTRHADRPWFAQLWLDDVHDPWAPSAAQLAAVKGKGRNADEEKFLAVLVAMDKEIGRLTAELERRGELADTLIVLTGDNGPTAARPYYRDGGPPPGDAGPYRGRKASLYEGGIREPLIVRWPGHVPAGSRDATTVAGAVDLFPTLAAITGAAPPASGDGISLLSAWRGQQMTSRPDLYWAYGGYGVAGKSPRPSQIKDRSPPFAIRSGNWKLLARGDGTNAQLYNIVEDPSETRDLAASRLDIARPLARKLADWRKTLPKRSWRARGATAQD